MRVGRLREYRRAAAPRGATRGGRMVLVEASRERPCLLLWRSSAEPDEGLELRPLTDDDERALAARAELERRDFELLSELLEASSVPLELLGVERGLHDEALEVFYRAPERADWRAISDQLRARRDGAVTWRQVTSRAKAQMCGGVGVCGRELCCSTVLRDMPVVTFMMARGQGRGVSPEQTAGACGRLKCCLRYELDELPGERSWLNVGARVACPRLGGAVIVEALDELGRTARVRAARSDAREVFLRELYALGGEAS